VLRPPASGERFGSGRVRQRTRIRQEGRLLWWEQGVLTPAAMASPLGLNGVSASAPPLPSGAGAGTALLARLRAADPLLALSQVKSVFVARYLCDDSEAARAAMLRTWQALRPHLLDKAKPACRASGIPEQRTRAPWT
jgi:urease accessory protein